LRTLVINLFIIYLGVTIIMNL